MVLFRSLTVGLLGACLYFLVELARGPTIIAPPIAEPAVQVGSPVTVIDIAPTVDARVVPSLVRVAPGERIVAVADRPVASDLEAGATIVERYLRHAHDRTLDDGATGYIDITIDGGAGSRRVLVLMH